MPLLIVKKDKYENSDAILNVINYIVNSEFTSKYLIGSIATLDKSVEDMVFHFELVQNAWNKSDKKRIQHIILSIDDGELITTDEIFYMGYIIANYIGERFQAVFAVHTASKANKYNRHIHFAINTVSYVDGMRFYGTNTDFYDIVSFAKSHYGKEFNWKLYYD